MSGKKPGRHKGIKRRMGVFALLMLAFLLWAFSSYWQQTAKLQEQKKAQAVLQMQKAQLEEQRASLQEQMEKLKDEEFLAELARSRLFYSKEGEILFITPKEQQAQQE